MKPSEKLEEFSVIEIVNDVMASNGIPLEPVTPIQKERMAIFLLISSLRSRLFLLHPRN